MTLAQRLSSGAPLLATFVKTPHPAVIEVLGASGLDLVILDAEHAPFGTADTDRCILAARAVRMPVLVRLPDDRAATILRVLDMGADGIVVPHVTTPAQAAGIVRAARYGEGGRGYAATTRAGGYGARSMPEHLAASRTPVVIAQIEDPGAVEAVEEIAATDGLSALFVGPADLAVAYGVDGPGHARVEAAVDRVIAAGRAAGRAVATFAGTPEQAASLFARGMSMVALASEHSAIQRYFAAAALAGVRDGK